MIENRKFIRLRAPIGVTYKLVKKNRRPREIAVLLKDIGGGGVRLMTQGELRSGDMIAMRVDLPLLESPIQATGEVVWSRAYEAGVRFLDIKASALREILEYVHTVGIDHAGT